MVKVILKPIDNDHKPVELSEGKTILGRGPLLGCSDKKVSRNHAVLEINTDGEIFLTPTHVNPCFYRTKSDASPKMMKKDKALRLEPGDVFSLLPLTFQYQILLSGNETTEESTKTVEASKEEANQEVKSSDTPKETKEEGRTEEAASWQAPAKENLKTGLNENGKPNQEEDEFEFPDDDDEPDEEFESPKPKRRPLPVPVTSTRGRKRGASASAAAVSSQDQPRRKRSLPSWLIKSASIQQDKNEGNNGDALQKEDRSKRRGRKSQSEGGSVSRSARQNRQTIQRISLEDFVVSEDDWNSDDSGDGRGGGGRGTSTPRRGRRRAAVDNSSGSDWEAEHQSQGRGGRDAARDASSGSDWEATSNTRRSARRGTARRRAATGDSESGSDWETDRRKKAPVQKKPRGRRSRKKMEDEDEEEEEENEEKVEVSDAEDRVSPKKGEEEEEDDEDEEEEEVEVKGPAAPLKKEGHATAGRKPCQFGRKCYRKNTAHLETFSHPGDSDYESPQEEGSDSKSLPAKRGKEEKGDSESSDQKPECPDGADCVRKNAQHKKDFLHTKKGRPKREATKTAAKRTRKGRKGKEDDEDAPNDVTDDESNDFKPDESEEK